VESVESSSSNDVSLHLVAGAVRRGWAVILVMALVLGGGAAWFLTRQAAEYTSTASVLLRPVPGNALSPNLSNGQQVIIAIQTESALVKSPGVAKLVSNTVGHTVNAGSTAVKVTVPPNTQVVQISVTDRSAAAAQSLAQAYAEAFLNLRKAQASSTQGYQLASLQAQERAIADNLKKATKATSADNAPADAAAQVQVYATRLASVQDSIGALKSSKLDPGTVVSPAPLPKSTTGIAPPALLISAAAIFGLALGFVIAIWRERRDDRVRAATVDRVAGVPILASIPRQRRPGPELISLRPAEDPVRNAYRTACVGITASLPRGSALVVAAVSDGPRHGLIATNLALTLSNADFHVVLVEAILDNSDVPDLLETHGSSGLAAALDETATASSHVVNTHGVDVLTAGEDGVLAPDRLAGASFSDLVQDLRKAYDFVIVASPTISSADGHATTLAGDGVVFVVDDNSTTHEETDRAVATAERLGIPVVGTIVRPTGGRARALARKPMSGSRRGGHSAHAAQPGHGQELARRASPSAGVLEPASVDISTNRA
jgi:capsular polysaccharide biosynthesis protein/Mrp family chromosome partitioning ATPase